MSDDRGAALILALMGVFLTAALSASLAILTGTETRIAANYASAKEARYAAEAGLELATLEVMAHPDWNELLGGMAVSALADGPPGGTRVLGDGSILDLDQQTRQARIGNPSSRLFAFGSFNLMGTGDRFSDAYIAVWIGTHAVRSPGGMIVRATSFGPSRSRKSVEIILSRSDIDGTQVLSWKEIR